MPAASSPAQLEKLLVCTDGSPESQGAINAALDLARTYGSKVYLLQVVAFIPGYELQSPDLLPPPPLNLEVQAAGDGRPTKYYLWWGGPPCPPSLNFYA